MRDNRYMKEKWVFICQQCGQKHSKWAGRCQGCGEWNSVVEERDLTSTSKSKRTLSATLSKPTPINEVMTENYPRMLTDLSELDNVLGGGLVPGSVVLLGGEPGVGKSTILLQAAEQYTKNGKKVLYCSGEESVSQIGLRAQRLGVKSPNMLLASETSLQKIFGHLEDIKPDLFVLDSVQTVYSEEMDSQPGSVGQLRECAFRIINYAKEKGIACFLVGHVTKEGAIAGPKILEHMVDVVLYFESTASQNLRLLRSIKNRFGSTNEIGVFEMLTEGMKQVTNPSELFLSERPKLIPGSVITASMEGTRPLLIEVQALASTTSMSIPRRTSIGLDPNRVSLLVAILEKRGGFRFFDQDVYVNIAGGLRISEPAVDLAVIAALISSFTGKAVETQSVYFGEVGLGGEVRSVSQPALRLKEAEKIGMKKAFVPSRVAKDLKGDSKLEIIAVDHVQELVDKI